MKKLRNFILDSLLWSYFGLSLYKIIYQNYIVGVRYLTYNLNDFLLTGVLGILIASIFSFLPYCSITTEFSKGKHSKLINKPFFIFFILILITTFINGLYFSQFSIVEFFSENGLAGAKRIFLALLSPNFKILPESLVAAVETIFMAFIATTFAIPVSFIISFFAAKNLTRSSLILKILYALTRFILNSTRSIEPLVWAIIFSVWVGIGPFAGMLALCLHSMASLSKLYSEQIENIDNGPLDAIRSTGAHPIQVIWYGVVPQIILPFLSFTIYRWDINVRMATIIGLVGGGGIGTMLMQYQGTARWNEVGLLVILIALIVWIMDYLSSRIREKIR